MARIKLSPIITDVRGTLGGSLTFQRRSDGHYLVKKPHPRDRQSTAQLEHRTKFLEARDAWLALSAEDKAMWNEDARAGTNMTGYAYFIQQNINAPKGLPKLDRLIDRWTARANTLVDASGGAAVDGELVARWQGVVNGLMLTDYSSSLRPRWYETSAYGEPRVYFAYDYLRLSNYSLGSGTAARTFAVLAKANTSSANLGVFNWTTDTGVYRGCGYELDGDVLFNSATVHFDAPADVIAAPNLHIWSSPEGARSFDYEYTVAGVSYTVSSGADGLYDLRTGTDIILGRAETARLYGDVYAFALWDDYLTAAERERITPEMLLEVP